MLWLMVKAFFDQPINSMIKTFKNIRKIATGQADDYTTGWFFVNIKMTQYNILNVKLSNSQLDKFKSAIKNETEVVLKLSSNMIGDNETNFPHKLLLTNRQVSNLRKAFANHLSTDIKLSKTQLSKMIQSGGCLGRLFGPLLKNRITFNNKCD